MGEIVVLPWEKSGFSHLTCLPAMGKSFPVLVTSPMGEILSLPVDLFPWNFAMIPMRDVSDHNSRATTKQAPEGAFSLHFCPFSLDKQRALAVVLKP
jgi:hypothetical protein